MGPLTSGAQREDVQAGIERLKNEGKSLLAANAVPAKGFFVSPHLFECDSKARAVHDREVFGPVASLLPYDKGAAEIVGRGNGGLVCSVYSEDSAWIEETVLGIAPWNGRIYLGHPKIELSPGPGTVLPQLVHGGPGRAGGGEELGGRRALAFYLQRVALEGSRPVIQALVKGGSG
jgi:3,4-dehydroadipyl-CoA semialdehyde dehydrogenase